MGFRGANSLNWNLQEREWVRIETLLEFASPDLGRVKNVSDGGCGGRELENGRWNGASNTTALILTTKILSSNLYLHRH